MASRPRRKFDRCIDCGTPGQAGDNLSYRGLCESCGVDRQTKSARQQSARSGDYYENWRASMRRVADRLT